MALVLVAGVSVFDGETRRANQDVLVRGSAIAAVARAGAIAAPPEATRLDGAGLTLLPGLIDIHVHLNSPGGPPWFLKLPDPAASARALLDAGVTTVLVAKHDQPERRLARRAAEGRARAPHMYLAGPGLAARGGHPIPFIKALVPWPISWLITRRQPVASTPEEARLAVSRTTRRYPTHFFKLFYDALPPGSPRLPLETLQAAVKEAKRLGLRPIVHIGSAQDMAEAAEAEVELLMHVAYEDRLNDEQVARIKASGIPVVTTSRIFSASRDMEEGRVSDFERRSVSPRLLESFQRRPKGWKLKGMESLEARSEEFSENIRANIRRLAAAGVPFFAGTDSSVPGLFPGGALHRELANLVGLGFSPIEILRSATSRPAAFLDPSGSFGRVAPGQRADLLLVRGDPTADIAALDRIEAAFLDGVRLERRIF